MVSSNTQRVEALETGMAEVTQRIGSLESNLQKARADFQKAVAEKISAKRAKDTQQVEAAVVRLQGRSKCTNGVDENEPRKVHWPTDSSWNRKHGIGSRFFWVPSSAHLHRGNGKDDDGGGKGGH